MIARPLTIGWYISRRFMFLVASIFLACLMLLFMVEFVQSLSKSGISQDVPLLSLAIISAAKIPALSEKVMPFAVLFASIGTYLGLGSKSELVVIRSAGLSAWQFLMPSVLTAFAIGIVTVTLYNPMAARFKELHLQMMSEISEESSLVFSAAGTDAWLRQDGVDGQTIIHARNSSGQGATLSNVTVYVYDQDDSFSARIEASRANLKSGFWELEDAWVISTDREPQFHASYSISTYLSAAQVQESFSDPDTVSFWQLQSFITLAERAGLSATGYRIKYQELLARPLFLAAMVLIAATTSLRIFRFGGIGRMVLTGILVGFLLFVVSKFLGDLGRAGRVNPIIAAWSPGIIGALAGLSFLLYQEDG